MKIIADATVSATSLSQTLTLDDLGITEQEWNKMNEEERMELIQEAFEGKSEDPEWEVNTFKIVP
jgi:hypothetical protein